MGETGARRRRWLAAWVACLALAVVGPGPLAAPAAADQDLASLSAWMRLRQGDAVVSPSGRYRLQLDHFGGLTLTERPNWINGTPEAWYLFGSEVEQLVFQTDGNLVAYRADGSVVRSFGTAGSAATTLRLQDDRNVVLLASSGAVVRDLGTYNDPGSRAGSTSSPATPSGGRAGPRAW